MRRITLFILIFCMSISPVAFAAEDSPITIYIDGIQLEFDVNPVIENDRTLVPMRRIFEALGADVTWDPETRTAIASKDGDVIKVTIDSMELLKNDKAVTLDTPARLIDGRTLVPLRAVSESLGAGVKWIGSERKVLITSKIAGGALPGSNYGKLSEDDMKKLKASYNNLIRYDFEQRALPEKVLTDNEAIVNLIKDQSHEAKDFAFSVWNRVVIKRIFEIQATSDDVYIINADDDGDLNETYLSIVREAGLEAHDYFDVSFETLKDKSKMMLITFRKTDTILACKFIGVVVRPNGTVRYFTAETDVLDKDNLYFCEVKADKRGTLGQMGFEKSDFIKAVNVTLEKSYGI